MSGIHGGVQAILKRRNKKAIFNGCVDHSLNLCGQHSFDKNMYNMFNIMYNNNIKYYNV